MNRAELALDIAEQVLDRPRRDLNERDHYSVRGLAAYLLYSTGRMSWQAVANNVYGVGNSHRRAIDGASRWAGTREAQDAKALFDKRYTYKRPSDVWDVISDLTNRIEKLETA